jgi:hypothetical protein
MRIERADKCDDLMNFSEIEIGEAFHPYHGEAAPGCKHNIYVKGHECSINGGKINSFCLTDNKFYFYNDACVVSVKAKIVIEEDRRPLKT